MFHKVHFKLTLLCSGITIIIILVMSFIYLSIAENNIKDNSFASFESDMNTLLSNLENQTVITYKWLSNMEESGKYQISIWDNGSELLFNNRIQNDQKDFLLNTVRSYYDSNYQTDAMAVSPSSSHQIFSFSSVPGKKKDYYACVAYTQKQSGTLQVFVMKSLAPLDRQIWEQRITFLFLVSLFSAALFLFAWYFTKKLLNPIEENQKSQIQFVAAASHELRTPLTVLLSAASACENAKSEEQSGFFKIIQEEGSSMSRLITDLLTLAGADSRTWDILQHPCELDTLLLDTYEAFEPLAKEKGCVLDAKLPDVALPAVLCDSERIRQVLSILLHNAFCYTPPGSKIILALEKKDRSVVLTVSDNGPGIPDEKKERIFDRFYRIDSARTSGHFGLGLCIAQEIMQAHHGSIRVLDTPGGGATFAIYLPIT